MIYKVFYQKSKTQAPIRENTHSLYVEASTVHEVRQYLADRNYNIEFILKLEDDFLKYEKASENYTLEKI